MRDACSRFVLTVTLTRTSVEHVKPVFEALFRKHGVPAAIQTDNGCPFINVRSRAGLSRLSAWWVSLGIRIVRSQPGCPQDNGGHERMHRDIAREIETRSAETVVSQQRLLDKWRQEFNHVRPHERLAGKTPAEVYRPSERRYQGPRAAVYPSHYVVKRIFGNGTVSLHTESYFISVSLAGHDVGLEQLDEFHWKIWFYEIECGQLEALPTWIDDLVPGERPSRGRAPRRDARRRKRSRETATPQPSATTAVSSAAS